MYNIFYIKNTDLTISHICLISSTWRMWRFNYLFRKANNRIKPKPVKAKPLEICKTTESTEVAFSPWKKKYKSIKDWQHLIKIKYLSNNLIITKKLYASCLHWFNNDLFYIFYNYIILTYLSFYWSDLQITKTCKYIIICKLYNQHPK